MKIILAFLISQMSHLPVSVKVMECKSILGINRVFNDSIDIQKHNGLSTFSNGWIKELRDLLTASEFSVHSYVDAVTDDMALLKAFARNSINAKENIKYKLTAEAQTAASRVWWKFNIEKIGEVLQDGFEQLNHL